MYGTYLWEKVLTASSHTLDAFNAHRLEKYTNLHVFITGSPNAWLSSMHNKGTGEIV